MDSNPSQTQMWLGLIKVEASAETYILGTTTVDGEIFAGLNIRGFRAIKVFAETFSRCFGHKYSLFSLNKERHIYSWKNFHGTLENHEKHESLAQRIFPHLQ